MGPAGACCAGAFETVDADAGGLAIAGFLAAAFLGAAFFFAAAFLPAGFTAAAFLAGAFFAAGIGIGMWCPACWAATGADSDASASALAAANN